MQDLLGWSRSRSGVVLLDPDGKLFDDVMRVLAARNLRHVPIVLIDLRRQDLIVGYNMLRRRRGTDPAVVVGGLVQAILHAWGQRNSSETPRLAKWLFTILRTLYDGGFTLAQAERGTAGFMANLRSKAIAYGSEAAFARAIGSNDPHNRRDITGLNQIACFVYPVGRSRTRPPF
jgi:hypothetical protein